MNTIEAREKALNAKPGDIVTVDPIWNRTDRRKLPEESIILDVRRDICQTGAMFMVRDLQDSEVWLDAGWFMEYKATERTPYKEDEDDQMLL